MRSFLPLAIFALLALVAISRAEARTWSSSGGQHTIDAELVEVSDGKAVLREAGGQLFLVEIAKLSGPDQQHLKQLGLYDGPIAAAPMGNPGAAAGGDVIDKIMPDVLPFFRQQDMANAKAKVDFYNGVRADGAEMRERIRVTDSTYRSLERVWTAFREGVTKLQAGHELQIGTEAILVVEADESLLVVRALGKNCRYPLDAPTGIPAKLVLAVIEKTARKTPELTAAIDLFKVIDSAKSDKSRWQIAAGPGPNVPFESLLGSATPGGTNPGGTIKPPLPERPVLPPPPEKKLAMPDAAAREKARTEVRELFKKDIDEAKNGQQKNDLARQFSKLAQESYPKEPATSFALIQEAIELTSSTGNASAAMFLVDWLVARYEVEDALRIKVVYLLKAAKAGGTIDGRFIGEHGLALMEEAAKAGRFDVVEQLAQPISVAARQAGEKELADKINARKTALADLKAASGEIDTLKKTLAATPDDPAANEKLGLITACVQENWETALPMLAKAADPNLSAAAKLDAANPNEPVKQNAAADAWWNLAESGSHAPYAAGFKARAVHWYTEALPGLSGLAKLKAEKRVKGE